MNNLMHNEEKYYSLVYWNNGDNYKNSMRFDDYQLVVGCYEGHKREFDNVEVRQYEVNYTVLFGKDGE